MKSILIPVDFSDCSFTASKYAAEIAKLTKAKLIFFNAYFVPFSGQEIYFSPEIIAEQEKSVMVKLMNFSNKVVQSVTDSSSLICHHVTMPGLLTNYISDLIEEHSIDMIVMGTKGASGLSGILLGSNTAEVIEKCSCPVLAVPSETWFKKPGKIVFATNYADNDFQTLYLLAEMFKPFNPEIIVLHVEINGDHKTENRMLEWFKGQVLTNIPYDNFSFQLTKGADVEHTVNNFILENDIELLSVSNRKRNFFDKLTSRSLSKKLAYHTNMPLLAFHAHSVSSTPIF